MAVVKADGYGLGALTVAHTARRAGATWTGTTNLVDAITLRTGGITGPILTWLNSTGIDPRAASEFGIDVAIGSADELLEVLGAASVANPVRVHLHADTGMARGGIPHDQWIRTIEAARCAEQDSRVRVVGMMGHLPHADSADPERNRAGLASFQDALRTARNHGLTPTVRHLAATSATLNDPGTHMDLVRIGAGLVGIDPSGSVPLNGATTFTAPITHSAALVRGSAIGYDGLHTLDRTGYVSVVGVGYADGIPRQLTPEAEVAVDGNRHRVIGRVSMDQIVIDTGGHHYPRGTRAMIFSPDSDRSPTVHDWARWAKTIPHTILTGIGPRVERQPA